MPIEKNPGRPQETDQEKRRRQQEEQEKSTTPRRPQTEDDEDISQTKTGKKGNTNM